MMVGARAYVGMAALAALTACAPVPAAPGDDLYQPRRITVGGTDYLVELRQVAGIVAPDQAPIDVIHHEIAVSRAAGQFTRSAADRAEAEAVATAWCRSLGHQVAPRAERRDPMFVTFQTPVGNDLNDEWVFPALCVPPAGQGAGP